ncbi:MAG: hypothetical protein HYY04_17010 [Chloroflexi bacterium]|nr:hypothetical protein [Chloroflexota bacterium]
MGVSAALLALVVALSSLLAESAAGEGVPVRRHVLALYDGAEVASLEVNPIHRLAEMPLNHLGIVVDLHDIRQGLPSDAAMDNYIGVLTWFGDPVMPDAVAYLEWLLRQAAAGRRIVVFGNLGALTDAATGQPAPRALVEQVYGTLGLRFLGNWTDVPAYIAVVSKDSTMVEFERSLERELTAYYQLVSVDPANRVYLKLRRNDLPNSESDLVLTGPAGGYALDAYVYHQSPLSFKRQWRINPFRFFKEAYGLGDDPVPDVSTLNGRRIFYAHVDGDGFNNLSEIDRTSLSADVISREIIQRYPLPITVSIIVADVEPDVSIGKRATRLAREIFSQPNVELASHTFTHPFNWQPDQGLGDRGREIGAGSPQGGVGKGATYRSGPFDLTQEIDGSVQYINERLAPPGKTVRVLLWSGAVNPGADAVERVVRLGIANLNGGDSRFDNEVNSYSGVAPLTAPRGRYRQVYSSNANDNIYSNLWTGPFYGLRTVILTFERTEEPFRLRPINIYYHFYSGQKAASLEALHEVYRWALSQPIAPITASEYVRIVEGFLSADIARVAPNVWDVSDYGALRTLRFDGSRARHVDPAASRNVLGYSHYQDALYVFLGGGSSARVALKVGPPDRGDGLTLAWANGFVEDWQITDDTLTFRMPGFAPKDLALDGLTPGRAYAIAAGAGELWQTHQVVADASGRLSIALSQTGGTTFRIGLAGQAPTAPEIPWWLRLLRWLVGR